MVSGEQSTGVRTAVSTTYIVEGALDSRSVFVLDAASQVFENRYEALIPICRSKHRSGCESWNVERKTNSANRSFLVVS
jgi:hypothetical protein